MGIQEDIHLMKRTLARIESQASKGAKHPKKGGHRLTEKQARQRTAKILKDIGAGQAVTVDQLGNIAQKHGMVRTATGALYAGGYVKKGQNGKVSLTAKGKTFKI